MLVTILTSFLQFSDLDSLHRVAGGQDKDIDLLSKEEVEQTLSNLHRTASYYRGRCTAGFCNVDTYFVFHCIGSFPRVFCYIPLSICERIGGIEPPIS